MRDPRDVYSARADCRSPGTSRLTPSRGTKNGRVGRCVYGSRVPRFRTNKIIGAHTYARAHALQKYGGRTQTYGVLLYSLMLRTGHSGLLHGRSPRAAPRIPCAAWQPACTHQRSEIAQSSSVLPPCRASLPHRGLPIAQLRELAEVVVAPLLARLLIDL